MLAKRSAALVAAMALLVAVACENNKNPAAPQAATCLVTVGQSSETFAAAGGTGAVAVTTTAGCAWTATSSASFITITQGNSGNGNGSVQFTVAANAGLERTGTITIAGVAVTITQQAAPPTIPPPSPLLTLPAPTPRSPSGGQQINSLRPALVVTNSATMGDVGTVTYHFEVSERDSFPEGSRTEADDVAEGSDGSTSWSPRRDLVPDLLYYWRARVTNGTVTSAWSAVETFRTPSVAPIPPPAPTPTPTPTPPPPGSDRVFAAFRLLDPATQSAPTTECRFKSETDSPTTCILESTSYTSGPNAIVSYSWRIQYTNETLVDLEETGTNASFSFTDKCGGPLSTEDGAYQSLLVQLTVVDSQGNAATAFAGFGGQPPLYVRLYTCGSEESGPEP